MISPSNRDEFACDDAGVEIALAIVAILALIFLGAQVSSILSNVGRSM